jgi:hypothetical protein
MEKFKLEQEKKRQGGDELSQGVRVTNMLYNHGPGSILETVQGPVVVRGWNEMIGNICSDPSIKDSRGNLLKRLEIIEPRLSSQLIGKSGTGIKRAKLHSLPTNESLKLETSKPLVNTRDFPNYLLCRKGEGHKNNSILYFSGQDNEKCPICENHERSSPIRFVAACNAGHLQDLPWKFMTHEKGSQCRGNSYTWRETSTSTSGIIIKCRLCDSPETSLSKGVAKLPIISCSGIDPSGVMEHKEEEQCDRSLSLALRSSTNLWQSDSLRAITIPAGELETCLEYVKKAEGEVNFTLFDNLDEMPPTNSPCVVKRRKSIREYEDIDVSDIAGLAHERNCEESWLCVLLLEKYRNHSAKIISISDFENFIEPVQRKCNEDSAYSKKLVDMIESYGDPTPITTPEAFSIEFENIFKKDGRIKWPRQNGKLFDRSGRLRDKNNQEILYNFGSGKNQVKLCAYEVTKLRVVTALKSFSRPVRDKNNNPAKKVDLSHETEDGSNWFAAVEAKGEGILLTFDDLENPGLSTECDRWNMWENRFNDFISNGVEKQHMFRGLRSEELGYFDNLDPAAKAASIVESHPMFVWWHTLSHHLIRTIQHDTGYSSSAINERIYAEKINGKWTGGILLYVIEGGMDGTLGGLTSLARNLQKYFDILSESSEHCSNDPLCSETQSSSLKENLGCYSCTYNSETSCEHRNLFVDRLLMRQGAGLN